MYTGKTNRLAPEAIGRSGCAAAILNWKFFGTTATKKETMIRNYSDVIVAVSAALVAVGATFESWIGLPLWLRLVTIAVVGVLVVWFSAPRFLPAIPEQTAGFRPPNAAKAEPSKKKWIPAAIVFFLISCALGGMAWLSTARLAIVATSFKRGDSAYLKLEPAYVSSDVIVNLRSGCEHSEQSARVIRINETLSNEQLLVSGFSGGQLVEINCTSSRIFDARDIEISKGNASLMFAAERTKLRFMVVLGGLLLWVFGLLRLRAL